MVRVPKTAFVTHNPRKVHSVTYKRTVYSVPPPRVS
jgi:hypothetical protein